MAGTNTVTTLDVGGNVTRYKCAWLSDASGNVNTNPFSVKPGVLMQLKFVPNGGGTVPTDLYDITLSDTDAVDVIGGAGANLSATAGVVKNALLGDVYFHDGQQQLDLVVTNAGNAKGGTVYLWVR
jgi:hypothetical protein